MFKPEGTELMEGTDMFVDALAQYLADRDRLNLNIRFNLIHRPLSDLFFVYNEQRYTVDFRRDLTPIVEAKCLLLEFDVCCVGFVASIGGVEASVADDAEPEALVVARDGNEVYTPDSAAAPKMVEPLHRRWFFYHSP